MVLQPGDLKGLAVDEAARLQSKADHDGILVSDEAYLMARGRANCTLVLGPELALKGIEHSVKTWIIDWAASPEGTDLEVQLPSKLATELRSRFPFANRRTEINSLGPLALGEAPSLAILRGPTGIGKTRVLAEWAEQALADAARSCSMRAQTVKRAHRCARSRGRYGSYEDHSPTLGSSQARQSIVESTISWNRLGQRSLSTRLTAVCLLTASLSIWANSEPIRRPSSSSTICNMRRRRLSTSSIRSFTACPRRSRLCVPSQRTCRLTR